MYMYMIHVLTCTCLFYFSSSDLIFHKEDQLVWAGVLHIVSYKKYIYNNNNILIDVVKLHVHV